MTWAQRLKRVFVLLIRELLGYEPTDIIKMQFLPAGVYRTFHIGAVVRSNAACLNPGWEGDEGNEQRKSSASIQKKY